MSELGDAIRLFETTGMLNQAIVDGVIGNYIVPPKIKKSDRTGIRLKLAPHIKEHFLSLWNDGFRVKLVSEVYGFLNGEGLYSAKGHSSTGDILGKHLLNLAKMRGKNCVWYAIPDPQKYAQWYEGSYDLPNTYYLESEALFRSMRFQKEI